MHRFLKRNFKHFFSSEYFDDVPPGESRGNVQCQDVQRLTFADESFDLVTSTEVFEHVADDRRGFAEIYRVLKPGGNFVFTVPLADRPETIERCRIAADGRIEHLLPPEYHGDRIRGRKGVLAFRTYGRDIVGRLESCGFAVRMETVDSRRHRISAQPVLIAHKFRQL